MAKKALKLDEKWLETWAADDAAFARGLKMISSRKWIVLAGKEGLVWGEIRSKQLRTFRVVVELEDPPRFRCNCSAPKPCPHIIGLLLLLLEDPEAFRVNPDLPEWVSAFLPQLTTKAAYQKSRPLLHTQNREARDKNKEKRLAEMKVGAQDLQAWLRDVFHEGLASLSNRSPEYWEEIATRMVDAKLKGVGRLIRRLPVVIQHNDNWPEEVLEQMGSMYLMARGIQQLEDVETAPVIEMFAWAGWDQKKKDVLESGARLTDHWTVLSVIQGEEDQLYFRRTWLYAEDHSVMGLLLEYVWGEATFEQDWKTGQQVEATVVFYPAAYPQRLLIESFRTSIRTDVYLLGYPDLNHFARAYAEALGKNPWLQRFPAILEQVRPVKTKEEWGLVDEEQQWIELANQETANWMLLSLSGGHPIQVFGEWNGRVFTPLSVLTERGILPLPL
jgi:hypothetical protein